MSQLRDVMRRSGIMLVPVDSVFALIDTEQSRVLIVSPAAAWVWSRLGTDAQVPEAHASEISAFIDSLRVRQLLGDDVCPTIPPVGQLDAPPHIHSQTPLQVAANTSLPGADPFLAV